MRKKRERCGGELISHSGKKGRGGKEGDGEEKNVDKKINRDWREREEKRGGKKCR